MQVKAIACELTKESGQPLSRYSCQDLVREVTQRGSISFSWDRDNNLG